jgi:hypothetical protein
MGSAVGVPCGTLPLKGLGGDSRPVGESFWA